MATTTSTGPWVQTEGDLAQSMPQRDFYKGDTALADTIYVEAHKLDFGFNASEIHIFNLGGGDMVYRWPRNDDGIVDNGVIEAGESRIWRMANKPGIRLRADAGATSYRVEAIA